MLNKYQNNLELNLKCDRNNNTICTHQYTTHPYRLSPIFRLDNIDRQRAYLYAMNTSPGLLAGDKLKIFLELENNSSLYFTDQSATKVHQMPKIDSQATVDYQIILRSRSCLVSPSLADNSSSCVSASMIVCAISIN